MLKIIGKIQELNEVAANTTTIKTTSKIPTAQEISSVMIDFAPIVILALEIVKIFTNAETDKKIDSFIALLKQ